MKETFDHGQFVSLKELEEASKQKLKGVLSPSLLDLKQLKHLDLSCNNFGRIQVPEFIGSLGNLRYLNLSSSNFSGIIPPQLGNISELHTLCLGSFQDWRGENTRVMNMEWLSNLRLLRHLDMSNVDLSKAMDWFQVINTLPSLTELHLKSNHLMDVHPHAPSLNITSLLLLDLSENYFFDDSLVPRWIFSITSLVSLDLSYCDFKGLSPSISSHSFPLDSLHNLTSLLSLDLSSNQLTNIIPKSLGNFCNLRDIDLSSNNFQNISLASLLESFLECKSPHLESLLMYASGLSGIIPDSIGRLSLLKSLGLSYNQFTGSLPNSLGQLSKLEELDFSSNFLTGVVTETHFVKLVHLKNLIGSGNNLILRPRLANWIPPFQLERLYLNSGSLGPQFPSWLISQRDLIDLDISNADISSPIPESFWRSFPNLEYLDMSKNQMQGTLNLSGIPALEFLYLSSNRFGGKLPDIINGPILKVLDLSGNLFVGSVHHLLCSDGWKETVLLNLGNNSLTGVIPECWEKWPVLKYLNLENNNFSGRIPRTLGHACNIVKMNMGGNKLEGKLPASLMKLTYLEILELSGNELAGSIPSWVGIKLSSLEILNLRSNKFVGKIPRGVCYLTHIQILDLSNNKLMGDIPKCFNNFSILSGKETNIRFNNCSVPLVMKGHEYVYGTILNLVRLLDLSNNKLVGHIPSELTTLIKLQSLNLSGNLLTGRIPEKIGDLKEIESFDLSLNKLSGELPMSLSSLNALSSFNVSYNNLTGKIPSSTQHQSLNESCFVGNKLCGDPLSDPCSRVETPDTDHEDDGSHGVDWGLIISVVSGFIAGFWVILAPLIVSRSWRIAYFRFWSQLGYMVYDVRHKMFSR
ncbi:hypothetical protein CTI12_AA538010 [Artemisia annua]|uniref:Leucine-rich repeat protein n=1 Tax=Artemisia annua TaxID=35608 RepID=A0A2U1KYS1_ARTAN|nr:hypothetical protein CTI12_AA538010 [Artemisia annua]